ncbi:uncharacterized protein LOC142557427 isoform X1 [Dermacentor variabilis]|uniref:uncharacterized protein LOC142557427 isoform X1 n=2 Tax=Dermacentor variabilis TaxID=34621 RepID=UPI003F5B4362
MESVTVFVDPRKPARWQRSRKRPPFPEERAILRSRSSANEDSGCHGMPASAGRAADGASGGASSCARVVPALVAAAALLGCALADADFDAAAPFEKGRSMVGTVHNLAVFKPRAKHCIKNVINYRDAPPDRRGRFHILLGRMVEYVDQMTERNYNAKIKLLSRSGSMLHKKFSDAFTRCVQDPCSQPPEPGWCLQNMVMFYYDPDRGSCNEFTYTGCGRNFNNFLTKQECRKICIEGRT